MMKRRKFFSNAVLGMLSVSFLGSAFRVENAFSKKDKLDIVDPKNPKDPSAASMKALGYVEKSKIKDKNCANCQFYVEPKDKHGKCQLFMNRYVPAEAYCNSWVKKA